MLENKTKTDTSTGLLLAGIGLIFLGCYCVAAAGYNADVKIYK